MEFRERLPGLLPWIILAGLASWFAYEKGCYFLERFHNESTYLGNWDWPIFVDYTERFLSQHILYDAELWKYAPAAAVYKFPPLFISVLVAFRKAGISAETLRIYSGQLHLFLFIASILMGALLCPRRSWLLSIPLSLVFAFTFEPFIDNYVRLQPEVFILFLLMVSIWCVRWANWFAAGLFVGLAVAIKMYPLLFTACFFLERRYSALAGIGVALAFSLIYTILVVGWPEHTLYFFHIVPAMLNEDIFSSVENISLGNFLLIAGIGGSAIRLICAVMLVGTVGCLAWTTRKKNRAIAINQLQESGRFSLALALLVVAFLLCNRNVWWNYQLLLAIPVLTVMNIVLQQPGRFVVEAVLVVLSCVLVYESHGSGLTDMLEQFTLAFGHHTWWAWWFVSPLPMRCLASLLVWIVLLSLLWRTCQPVSRVLVRR